MFGRPPNAGIYRTTQYTIGALQSRCTHHKVSVWQALAVPGDNANAAVRRNILYIISKDEINAFGSNLLLNGSAELVWIRRVQKLIVPVDNGDFLVLCDAKD